MNSNIAAFTPIAVGDICFVEEIKTLKTYRPNGCQLTDTLLNMSVSKASGFGDVCQKSLLRYCTELSPIPGEALIISQMTSK